MLLYGYMDPNAYGVNVPLKTSDHCKTLAGLNDFSYTVFFTYFQCTQNHRQLFSFNITALNVLTAIKIRTQTILISH